MWRCHVQHTRRFKEVVVNSKVVSVSLQNKLSQILKCARDIIHHSLYFLAIYSHYLLGAHVLNTIFTFPSLPRLSPPLAPSQRFPPRMCMSLFRHFLNLRNYLVNINNCSIEFKY